MKASMRKRGIVGGSLLALLVSLAAAPAMADRGDRHWGKHRDKHWEKHWKHDRHPGYRYRSWKPDRPSIHIHRYERPDYSAYLGAALIGSAITYSLSHSHDGVRCDERHDYREREYRDRRYEIIGCHRVERFADGSERRVRVPLSECD